MATGTDRTPPSEYEFIKTQSPGAKYVLSVCGGSFILANAGVLAGKRATTNKALFRVFEVCLCSIIYYLYVQVLIKAEELDAEEYPVDGEGTMGC